MLPFLVVRQGGELIATLALQCCSIHSFSPKALKRYQVPLFLPLFPFVSQARKKVGQSRRGAMYIVSWCEMIPN